MKRNSYVDSQGNTIDQGFESKKKILNVFFVISTIVPIILIGIIIFIMVQNNNANKLYQVFKNANFEYLQDHDKLPTVEGENVTVSINKLYSENYISPAFTEDMTCSGNIKTTKYKNEYIYTLNINNCGSYSTNQRYGEWSKEVGYYPQNKSILDVVPYYNYYDRQTVVTNWSREYEQEELQPDVSDYGFKLPKEELNLAMPDLPEEAKLAEIQKEDVLYYRFYDNTWKWYDIKGDYSDFSSTQPAGYQNKDDNTLIHTEWSEFSLNYPEEQSYREIRREKGYQYYYMEDGKKIYANNKNYVVAENIDTTKYTMRENKAIDMYSYRDAKWRWYNGQKRKYSGYATTAPKGYPHCDEALTNKGSFSNWTTKSSLNSSNQSYRVEEQKTKVKFRYIYEILSDPILKSPINREEFTQKVGMSIPDFVTLDNYKVEVSYKFKYRKR